MRCSVPGGSVEHPAVRLEVPPRHRLLRVNHRVWITNNAAGTIYVYDDQGNFLFQIGDESIRRNAQTGYFEKPEAIAFGNGYAYVTDTGNQYPGDSPRVKILDALTGHAGRHDHRPEQGCRGRPSHRAPSSSRSPSNKITAFPAAGGAAKFSVGSAGTGNGQFTGHLGRGDHRPDPVRER